MQPRSIQNRKGELVLKITVSLLWFYGTVQFFLAITGLLFLGTNEGAGQISTEFERIALRNFHSLAVTVSGYSGWFLPPLPKKKKRNPACYRWTGRNTHCRFWGISYSIYRARYSDSNSVDRIIRPFGTSFS